MQEWTFRNRLVALLLASLAVLGLLGGWALLELGRISDVVGTVYRDRIVPVRQLHSIEVACRQGIAEPMAHFRLGTIESPAVLQKIDAARVEMASQWARYKATELVAREHELIPQAERHMATVLAVADRLRPLVLRRDVEGAGQVAARELGPALEALGAVLQQLVDVQLDVARAESERARALYDRAAWVVAGLVAVALATGGLLAAWVLSKHSREQAAAEARTERMRNFYREGLVRRALRDLRRHRPCRRRPGRCARRPAGNARGGGRAGRQPVRRPVRAMAT
jgi:methyl-accepting chemotaxis protein